MCGKRKPLPMVHPPINLTQQPVPESCPVLMLDQDLSPLMGVDFTEMSKGPMTLWEMPLPHGCFPVLLITGPEDVATLMRPSVADILSCILGSLLPGLVGVSDCQELYRSRAYQAAGRSRSSTGTKGSMPPS